MRRRVLELAAEPANVEDLARELNVSDAAALLVGLDEESPAFWSPIG